MACASFQENLIIICVIIVGICNPVKGQATAFSIEPSDVQVRAGENGSLLCVLNEPLASDCFWNRNDQKVDMDVNSRYAYTGNRTSGNCSISILNSNVNLDDGLWECGFTHTSDVTGSKSRKASYTVLVVPNEPVIKVDGVTIQNGGYITMDSSIVECVSENGKPATNLTWMTTNGPIVEGNYTVSDISTENQVQTATILLPTPIDSRLENQELTCMAEHPAYKNDESHKAYATINYPSDPTSAVLSSNYSGNPIKVDKDKGVNLTCQFDGIPAPASELQKKRSNEDQWSVHQSSTSTNILTVTISAFDAQFKCVVFKPNGDSPIESNIITIVTSSAQQTNAAIAMNFLVAVAIFGSQWVLTS